MTALTFLTSSAFANCRINLETRGLTPTQVSEVKTLLAKKNYTVARKLQGNETDLYVQMYELQNCIPGFSALYESSGGYQLQAPALNLDVDRTVTFSKMSFKRRLYQSLKNNLSKIPACH